MPPRKKTETVAGLAITCPACACSISPDGSVLHAKSPKYLEWLKTGEVLGTLEQKFSELVTDLDSYKNDLDASVKRIQVLELQLTEANARLEKPNVVERQEQRRGSAPKATQRTDEDGW